MYDMYISGLLIVGSYFWASIPSAYLVSKYIKGIDIRDYGSGNMGATNVMAHVGRFSGFFLGVFDCLGKGVLPVSIVSVMNQSDAVKVAVALVSIVGHNWTPFLKFTGGRGVATAMGVIIGFQLWPECAVLVVVLGILGRILIGETALCTLLSVLLLPALIFFFNELGLFDRSIEILFMSIGICVVVVLKRVTANWERLPEGYSRTNVIFNRIIWDRDLRNRVEWTSRSPESHDSESSNVNGENVGS